MKVYHPTIPDLAREVPDAASADWLEAGWVKAQPKTDKKKEG